jgi:hypothetical protein
MVSLLLPLPFILPRLPGALPRSSLMRPCALLLLESRSSTLPNRPTTPVSWPTSRSLPGRLLLHAFCPGSPFLLPLSRPFSHALPFSFTYLFHCIPFLGHFLLAQLMIYMCIRLPMVSQLSVEVEIETWIALRVGK